MHRTCLAAALLASCLGMSGAVHAAAPCSAIAADLAAMAGADQALRKRIDFLDTENPEQVKLRGQLMLVDRTNTERLNAWIARCGWPSRAAHGDRAAGDAWLLAQHADHDVAFQKKVLVLIEQDAASSGKGVDQLFALLADRIAVAEKRPQRYGTQLVSRGSSMCDLVFQPMDDREQVEARRAALKLPPLEDYKRIVMDMQHCPVDSPKIKSVNGVPVEPFKDYHYAPPAPNGTPAGKQLRRK